VGQCPEYFYFFAEVGLFTQELQDSDQPVLSEEGFENFEGAGRVVLDYV
jgi:hypothetical protein